MDALGVSAVFQDGLIGQKVLLARAHDHGNDIVNAMFRTNGRVFRLRNLRHGVECQCIAPIGFAQGAELERREVEQLQADVVERAAIAEFQFEFDLDQRLSVLARLDRSLVEGNVDLGSVKCQPLHVTTELSRKDRREAMLRKLTESGIDLRRQAGQIRRRVVDRRLQSLSRKGRLVGAGKLQGLNVAGTVTPYAQRAALAGEGAIRCVVVNRLQPAHHAAVARMSHDHRSSTDPFDRLGRCEELQLHYGVGVRVRT